jgi:hypothetical protein
MSEPRRTYIGTFPIGADQTIVFDNVDIGGIMVADAERAKNTRRARMARRLSRALAALGARAGR